MYFGWKSHGTSLGGYAMKSKKLGVIATILFCAIGLASCQTPYHEDGERYVFVATNVNLPYWQEAHAGLTDAAKQMGGNAELVCADKVDPQEGLKAFQKEVEIKPAGTVIAGADAQ